MNILLNRANDVKIRRVRLVNCSPTRRGASGSGHYERCMGLFNMVLLNMDGEEGLNKQGVALGSIGRGRECNKGSRPQHLRLHALEGDRYWAQR